MSDLISDPPQKLPLNVRVATDILGFHVERIVPKWYGREVLLFFYEGFPLVEYSWDANACNAVMFRNGVDEKDGNAPCLPLYHDEPNDALDVVGALVGRGFAVTIHTHPKIGEAKAWEVTCINHTTGVEVVGFGNSMAEAICEAALLAVHTQPVEPNVF